MPKSQQQRSRERKRRDREDSDACERRANNLCEICGIYCAYRGYIGGSLHHARRKKDEATRRNRDWHFWLCDRCHSEAHSSNPQEINAACERIIEERENEI